MSEAKVKEPQVASNMTKKEAAALARYAKRQGLTRPKLCMLLILRELNLKRLGSLKAEHHLIVSKASGSRVTARVRRKNVKDRFAAHARRHSLKENEAAGVVFRAEIGEKWLAQALGAGNQP